MPYTKDGIVPDIVMNPAAFPSRMTIAQMIECVLGKACALNGYDADATPFTGVQPEEIEDILEKIGFERSGTEILYSGKTGEQLKANIFIGPTFYYRLKHLVSDKIHCLTMDHEVLTEGGWKFYPDLTKEDKIATLKDGELVYEKSIELLYYPDYQGEMYRVKTNDIDLSVTSNHRMYVSEDGKDYNLIKAEDIDRPMKYLKNAPWTKIDYPVDDNEIIKYANSIENSLENWVWELSQRQAKLMVESMKMENGIYYHQNEKLIDDSMKLLLHAGLSGNKKKMNEKGLWELEINQNHQPIVDNNFDIAFFSYEGPVFCLQVPSEIFYVRRNGLPVWTGNSRATGPYQLLVRQASEGRSRAGGLRSGEMEKDCMLAHGTMQFLKERMFDNSDKYIFWVCKECGMIAIANPVKNIFKCTFCKNSTSFAKVQVPYATKLLMQELMTMNIVPRLQTDHP